MNAIDAVVPSEYHELTAIVHSPAEDRLAERERAGPRWCTTIDVVEDDAALFRLREIFDSSAQRYQRARPEYPMALYDELIALTGVTPDSHLLEIGCATGKGTLPLARRGFRITALELGAELVTVARKNLARYPLVRIEQGAFES